MAARGFLIEVQKVDQGALVSEDSFNTGNVQDTIPVGSCVQGVLNLSESNLIRVLKCAQILSDRGDQSGVNAGAQTGLQGDIDQI